MNREILDGKIFIYPTDTVYGLGCNALNISSVEKIKKIKNRDFKKPLSIIAPSLKWIEKYCLVDFDLKKYLPGPYTLILKKKNKNFLKHVSSGDSIGVRMPDNEFCDEIRKTEVPFITTSVNLSGEKAIIRISEIPKNIKDQVDIIVDEGELSGRPSTIVIDGKEIKR
jgi:L-threonylcarbamoyladenylate synthase